MKQRRAKARNRWRRLPRAATTIALVPLAMYTAVDLIRFYGPAVEMAVTAVI